MRLKPAALDIETKYEIGRRPFSSLGLAVACLLIDGEEPQFFEERHAGDLLAALAQKELLIIGHNIQKFDYEVLRPYWPSRAIGALLPRTFDTMLELAKYTGRWHSLGDLALLNFGERKKEDGAEAPALWRSGERGRVKAYCAHDAQLALRLYKLGAPFGKIRVPYNGRVREILVSW